MSSTSLGPVVREVVDRHRATLEAERWCVEVEEKAYGTVTVKMVHPLVPGETGLAVARDDHPTDAVAFLEAFFTASPELAIVRNAPIRTGVESLVRSLRAAGAAPRHEDAAEAVMSVAFSLAEEGVLTFTEAEWLEEALQRDREDW